MRFQSMSPNVSRVLVVAVISFLSACGPVDEVSQSVATQREALVGSATTLAVTLPASAVAGTPINFTVTARTSAGAVATDFTDTVTFASNFPQVVMPANYTFTASDLGQHTFSFTPLASGPQTVTVTDTTSAGVQAAAGVPVVASTGARFVINSIGTGTGINVGAATTLDVTAYDAYWNVATSYAGSMIVTTDDPAAVLPASPVFVNGNVSGVRITFNTAGGHSVTVTDAVLSTMTDTAWATIASGPNATVTAPTTATTLAAGLTASVPAQAGVTYAWSITGGTLTSATTSNTVTFSAGAVGTLRLTCVVTTTASGAASTGSANVTITAAVAPTATVTAPTSTTTLTAGLTASVPAQAGVTYAWSITGGTLTSVTTGNTVTFTAGAVGTLGLTCVVTNTTTGATSTGTANVTVVAIAAPIATITAPTSTTTLTAGLTASVPAQAGVTYAWSITGGTLTSATTGNTVTFTAGAVGTLNLGCVVTNTTSGVASTGSANVTVVASAGPLAITAPVAVTTLVTANKASVAATTGMHYQWSLTGGTITSSTAGVTSAGRNTVTFTAGAVGTATLTVVELTAANVSSAPAIANVPVVARPVTPVIASATPVTTAAQNLTATVPAVAGRTYTWTITGGTITSAGGATGVTTGAVNQLTFTAGVVGTLKLTCVERNAANLASTAGSKSLTVVAAPVTPVITAASPVVAGATALKAQVPARTGMKYLWTLSGGTITNTGGTAGVTAAGINSITWTAGAAGVASITCLEFNTANTQGAPASKSVTISASANTPVQPVITSSALVTVGQSTTASVTARTGLIYAWTVTGGTVTSAGGTAGVTSGGRNTITFTPAAEGPLTVRCTESNGLDVSLPGTATLTALTAPQRPVVTAPGLVQPGTAGLVASVDVNPNMTYLWTISGGTITSAGGAAGVSNGVTNSITFTAGSFGSVSLSCVERNAAGGTSAAGTASVGIDAPTGVGHFYAVGHQDDDVIFFDPDIEASILSNTPTRVVWVIAGSSGSGAVYWQARENQARNALAVEAGVSSTWTCAQRSFANKLVTTCTLDAKPTVSAAFLRIPDTSAISLWVTNSGAPFYTAPVAQLTAADGAATYTRTALIDTLTALIADFGPSRISTMDGTLAYGDDNLDHVASSLFTLEAARRWGQPHQLRVHRGYNVDLSVWGYTNPVPELPNLSSAVMAEKDRVMLAAYGLSCSTGGFSNWCARHYAIDGVPGGLGALVEPGGLCVDLAGGSPAVGAQAVVAPCTGVARQSWTVDPTGSIGNANGCLAVAADGVSVKLAACNGAVGQRWLSFANGQVRGPDSSCLSIGDDGVTLQVQYCDANRAGSRYTPALHQQFVQRP